VTQTLPTPWREPLAYDQIEIAGRLWPGICRIANAEQLYKWQVNDAKGSDGATTTYQGGDIAKPKLVFVLWEGTDDVGGYVNYFLEWDAFRPVLETSIPPPGSKRAPIALAVKHPLFQHARIGAISLEKIGQPTPDGEGGMTVEVDILDFRPPKPAGGTPLAAAEQAPGARPKTEIEQAVENEANTTGDLLAQASAPEGS
jgi:hypothetical protein